MCVSEREFFFITPERDRNIRRASSHDETRIDGITRVTFGEFNDWILYGCICGIDVCGRSRNRKISIDCEITSNVDVSVHIEEFCG